MVDNNGKTLYPNIHYISVVEENGGRVLFKRYEMQLPRQLLDRMQAIVEDDVNGDLLALQDAILEYYSEAERVHYF